MVATSPRQVGAAALAVAATHEGERGEQRPSPASILFMVSPFILAGRVRQWLGAVPAARVWTACQSLPLTEYRHMLSLVQVGRS